MKPGISLFAILVIAAMSITPAHAQDWSTLISGDEAAGYSIEGATNIDVQVARSLFDQGVAFVDFRNDSNWVQGHVPGATRCGNVTEGNILSIVSKDTPAVFYCDGPDCKLAADAAAMAVDWGFKNIHYFADGYAAWVAEEQPIATGH